MHSLHSQRKETFESIQRDAITTAIVNEASVMHQPKIPLLSFGCQRGHGTPPPSLETEGKLRLNSEASIWAWLLQENKAGMPPLNCALRERSTTLQDSQSEPASCLETSGLCPQRHERSKDTNRAIRCCIQEEQHGSMTPSSLRKSSNTHERHFGRSGSLTAFPHKRGCQPQAGSITVASSGPLQATCSLPPSPH